MADTYEEAKAKAAKVRGLRADDTPQWKLDLATAAKVRGLRADDTSQWKLDLATVHRAMSRNSTGEPVVAPGDEAAFARLEALIGELLDGGNALIGLIQLVCGRNDMPAEIREALLTSHRLEEARAAVVKAGSHADA